MNLVTATVENPKLCSMVFQDASSSMRSVMVDADVDMMYSFVMNGSCGK